MIFEPNKLICSYLVFFQEVVELPFCCREWCDAEVVMGLIGDVSHWQVVNGVGRVLVWYVGNRGCLFWLPVLVVCCP